MWKTNDWAKWAKTLSWMALWPALAACSNSEDSGQGSEGGAHAGGASSAGEGNDSGAAGAAGSRQHCAFPTEFEWSASDPLIVPKSDDEHELVAVKDPTMVWYNDSWHVFASSVSTTGAYNIIYTTFTDWAEASSAPFYYMDQTAGFNTYVAAPQLFFFTPQNQWYLVF